MFFSNHSVQAASFDCLQAKKPIEFIICKDNQLNRIDSEVGIFYRGVLRNFAEYRRSEQAYEKIKRQHRHFLRGRFTQCHIPKHHKASQSITKPK